MNMQRLVIILLVTLSLLCLVSRGEPDRGGALISEFLVPQNKARAKVGVPPLVWDEKVASYARAYANERRGDCALQHSTGPYGENLFWGGGSEWQPKHAVTGWVDEEIPFFNLRTRSCDQFQKCGHYTQVVWKNTQRVGCARAVCNNGDTFMTCNYDPPGNYKGEKPY